MYASCYSPDLPFEQVCELYLHSRHLDAEVGAFAARFIRENTESSYRQYVDSLKLFFSGMTMGSIEWHHLKAYQKARIKGEPPFIRRRRPHEQPGPCPAGPRKVNQELRFLKTLMVRSGSWTPQMEELYQPFLVEDGDVPRALSPEEQQRWLGVARMQPRWEVVHLYSLLAFGTCMSTDEIRGLRIGDVNIHHQVVTVPRKSSKTKYRARTIEIVDSETLWAAERLLARAADLGAGQPTHYLLPFRSRTSPFDPTRPMTVSGIKKLWEEVREASNLPWFRQYDCRHTAITRLAEAGVPIEVIQARAGHGSMSPRMTRHYMHVSQSAQRQWMKHAYEVQYQTRRPFMVGPSSRKFSTK